VPNFFTIHYSLTTNRNKAIELFLEAGGDINKLKNKQTVLDLAAANTIDISSDGIASIILHGGACKSYLKDSIITKIFYSQRCQLDKLYDCCKIFYKKLHEAESHSNVFTYFTQEIKSLLDDNKSWIENPKDVCLSNGYSLLHDAIMRGELQDIKNALPYCTLEHKGVNGWTALHYAIASGDENKIEYLLQQGANINARDYALRTPLHLAVYYERPNLIKLLIKHKADLQIRDILDMTAEDLALYLCPHAETEEQIKDSPLLPSIKMLQEALLETLTDQKTKSDKLKKQDLQEIVEKEIKEKVKEEKPAQETPSQTLQTIIAYRKLEPMVKNVLAFSNLKVTTQEIIDAAYRHDADALLNPRTLYFWTLLSQIANEPMLENTRWEECENSLFNAQINPFEFLEFAMTKLQYNNNSPANLINKNGYLHTAAKSGDATTCQKLLAWGANPVIGLEAEASSLHLALQSENCSFDLVKLLVDAMKKCDDKPYKNVIHAQPSGMDQPLFSTGFPNENLLFNCKESASLLNLAVIFQHKNPELVKIIDYLLNAGCRLDAVDLSNKIPNTLYLIARQGQHDLIRLLLEHSGPDITHLIIDSFSESYTPLHAAIQSKNLETVKTLLEFGANPFITVKTTNQTPEELATFLGCTAISKLIRCSTEGSDTDEDETFEEENIGYESDEENEPAEHNNVVNPAPVPVVPAGPIPVPPIVIPSAMLPAPAPQPDRNTFLASSGWGMNGLMRSVGALNEVICEPLAWDEALISIAPLLLPARYTTKIKGLDSLLRALPLCAHALKAFRGARQPSFCAKSYSILDLITQYGVIAASAAQLWQLKTRVNTSYKLPHGVQTAANTSHIINIIRGLVIPLRIYNG